MHAQLGQLLRGLQPPGQRHDRLVIHIELLQDEGFDVGVGGEARAHALAQGEVQINLRAERERLEGETVRVGVN